MEIGERRGGGGGGGGGGRAEEQRVLLMRVLGRISIYRSRPITQ